MTKAGVAVLAVLTGMALCAVAVVAVIYVTLFRSRAIDFAEPLNRTVHVTPIQDEGISFGSFDLSPQGTEIYYVEANFFDERTTPAVFVRDVETDSKREFFTLAEATYAASAHVSVVNNDQILVVDDTVAHFVNRDGVVNSTIEQTTDVAAFCADLLADAGDFDFVGFDLNEIGKGEAMTVTPLFAQSAADGTFALVGDCDDEVVSAVAGDLERHWPKNQTNFENTQATDNGNLFSFAGQSDVLFSNPEGSGLVVNFDCERFTDFVIKVGEMGYESNGSCAGAIRRLPSSLRYDGGVFVLEGDEIIGLR